MSSAPSSPQGDDVGRLLKQLDLDAFRFRSFERPGSDSSEHGSGSEFQPSAGLQDAASGPPLVPTLSPVVPASPAGISVKSAPLDAMPVDAEFNRLIRHNAPRTRQLPGFKLDLAASPRIVEQAAVSGLELPIGEVLNRLYRLSGSKMSLIRQRGDA